jgi:hypothetical protein
MMTRPYWVYVIHDIMITSISFPLPLFAEHNNVPGKTCPRGATPPIISIFSILRLLPKCLLLTSACHTGVCTDSCQRLSAIPANDCPASAPTATTTTTICPTTTATTTASSSCACAGSLGWQRWTAYGQCEWRWLSADCGGVARNRRARVG